MFLLLVIEFIEALISGSVGIAACADDEAAASAVAPVFVTKRGGCCPVETTEWVWFTSVTAAAAAAAAVEVASETAASFDAVDVADRAEVTL